MDTLPNEVLLAIFNSYLNEYSLKLHQEEREKAWRSLVHVCRRWRTIVFGSPRHLDLQLVCRERTRTRDALDIWPDLPLVIKCRTDDRIRNLDNIVAVLERSDRVCQIDLDGVSSSNLAIILAAMQQPFPELTFLQLWSYDVTMAIVPDSFLGGFASRLEFLVLSGIPFPGLPKLLLSATHLVHLNLYTIPHSGYISPERMVAALSTLTSLETLIFGFQSPRSCPDWATRHLPPSPRSVLPLLSSFMFKGVTEYLEDFVALIDTPQLFGTSITFFNDVVFDTPQLIQSISRSPMLRPIENVHINFWNEAAYIHFLSQASSPWYLNVEILCRGLEWQVSSLQQVCTSCFPLLSMPKDLYIYERPDWQLDWKENIENGLWVELLHPFTAMKNLYVSEIFARHIAPALQELVGDRITEVLPSLENIFLEGLKLSGSVEEGIGHFVAAREVAGHPITISHWDGSKEKISLYYYVG